MCSSQVCAKLAQKFWSLLNQPASHGPFRPKLWTSLATVFVDIFWKEKNWVGFRPFPMTHWKEFLISWKKWRFEIFWSSWKSILTLSTTYSHGHFWFVKNQFFWNFCFSVKDAEKFIKHHLFIYKRFTTDQNFKGVTQKLRLPRPWQVQNWPNYTMPFYYVKVPK